MNILAKNAYLPTFASCAVQYHLTKSELETRTLWVTVWNNDTFGRNDFLGEVTIPLDYYQFNDPAPRWHKLQDRVRVIILGQSSQPGQTEGGIVIESKYQRIG